MEGVVATLKKEETHEKVMVDQDGVHWKWNRETEQWEEDDGANVQFKLGTEMVTETPETRARRRDRQRRKRLTRWILAEGLPAGTPEADISQYFAKAGLIKLDEESGRPEVLVESSGTAAYVRYFKPESVALALELLDETWFDPSHKVCVSASEKPAHLLSAAKSTASSASGAGGSLSRHEAALMGLSAAREKRRRTIAQEAQLSWDDAETRQHLLLRGMYTLDEIRQTDVSDLDAYYRDLRTEILEEARTLGDIKVCHVFRNHPEGLVSLKFEDPEVAAECVRRWNGRRFAGRSISVEFYDMVTDFSSECLPDSDLHPEMAAEDDAEKRLENFGSWLDEQ